MRDFESEWKKSNRQFNFFFNFVIGGMIVVFLGIVSFYAAAAYFAVKTVQSMSADTPDEVGRAIGKFIKGVNEGQK